MGRHTFTQKFLPLALAAAMAVPAVPAMAATNDISGHWAEKVMAEWQEKGLMKGYSDGSLKPNNSITRAEFITLLNNAKGLTAESSISFTDVKQRDWFFGAVARAAGYTKGYEDGSFRPNQTITRAEAAIMLANAAGLTANEGGANGFTDAIPAWAKGSIGAVAAAGFMSGYPDGSFGASANITRAEAVSSLDRMLNGAQETEPSKGEDVVIEKAGTVLENETVTGNLTIAASVGEGDVTLKNVEIKGDLIVKGGGSNSISLEDVKVGGKLMLDKDNVHLSIAGNTNISNAEMKSPARITMTTFDTNINTLLISLDKPSEKDILIDATIGKLELETKANLILGANVNQLIVGKNAENSKIQIKSGSTVDRLTANAKVTLTGAGKINQLNAAASGVMLDSSLSVKKTVTDAGVKAPTITGGSSGGGGSASAPKIAISGLKNPIGEIQVNVGDLKDETEAKKSLPSRVTLLVDDKEIPNVTAEISGWKITGGSFDGNTPGRYTFVGTVTIPTGYTYNGTLTAEATITVVESGQTAPKKKLTGNYDSLVGMVESYTRDLIVIKASIPGEVYLECEDGSQIVGKINNTTQWDNGSAVTISDKSGYTQYTGFSCSFQNITLPAGYECENADKRSLTADVYVKERNNTKLQRALDAAWAQLDRTTDTEAEALADTEKIYVLPENGSEDNVALGVKYVQESQFNALYNILPTDSTNQKIKDAKQYQPSKQNEDNQDHIDELAQKITAAANILASALDNPKTGKKFTNENILANIRERLGTGNSNYAYSDNKQPWTPEKYNTVGSTRGIALPWEVTWVTINANGDTATVKLKWSIEDNTGASLLADANENNRQYIRVTGNATEPQTVKLTVTAIDNDLGLNNVVATYNCKVGAPISANLSKIADVAVVTQLTSGQDGHTFNVLTPLQGDQNGKIKTITNSNITATYSGSLLNNLSFNRVNEPSLDEPYDSAIGGYFTSLQFIVNADIPQLPAVLASATNTYETATVTVSIPYDAIGLTSKAEEAGWYIPNGDLKLEGRVQIWHPLVKVEQPTLEGDDVYIVFNTEHWSSNYKQFVYIALLPSTSTQNPNDSTPRGNSLVTGDEKHDVRIPTNKLTAGETYSVWVKVGDGAWMQSNQTYTYPAPSTE